MGRPGEKCLPALLLLALVGCGGGRLRMPDAPPVAATAARPWPDDLVPPRLSTVGDLPPAGERVVVCVEADGRLSVDGEEIALAQLLGYLARARGRGRGERDPDASRGESSEAGGSEAAAVGARPVAAVLAVDESVPWRVSEWLLEDCALTRIGHVFFAARARDDDLPGAIATFLPEDVGLASDGDAASGQPAVTVRVRPGDEMASDPLRLLLPVSQIVAGREDAVVEIDPSAEVSTGAVLAVVDALSLAGGSYLSFLRTRPRLPRTGIRAEIRAARQRPVAWGFELVGGDIEGPAPSGPPPRRSAGRYAGFARTARGLLEEEPVEEPQEAPTEQPAPARDAGGAQPEREPADTD